MFKECITLVNGKLQKRNATLLTCAPVGPHLNKRSRVSGGLPTFTRMFVTQFRTFHQMICMPLGPLVGVLVHEEVFRPGAGQAWSPWRDDFSTCHVSHVRNHVRQRLYDCQTLCLWHCSHCSQDSPPATAR